MSRYLELMNKSNRTELENLEYNFLDKVQNLDNLITMAEKMGNKNWRNNFMIKDSFEQYKKAKAEYENAKRSMGLWINI